MRSGLFRLLTVFAFLAIPSLTRAQIYFHLSNDETHDITLFKGDTIRDTIVVVNDANADSIKAITPFDVPEITFTPFQKLPIPIKAGENPIGIITITGATHASCVIGYSLNGGGFHPVQQSLNITERVQGCLTWERESKTVATGVLPFQVLPLKGVVGNETTDSVTLDSIVLSGTDANYFRLKNLQYPIAFPYLHEAIEDSVQFLTTDITARTYTATLTAYSVRCDPISQLLSITVAALDTTDNPKADTIFFFTDRDSLVRRVILRNEDTIPRLLKSIYIYGSNLFQVVGRSFTPVLIGVKTDTMGHQDTLWGYFVKPGEEIWVDVVFHATERGSLVRGTLDYDSIGAFPRLLLGYRSGSASVETQSPIRRASSAKLLVSYDEVAPRIELNEDGRGTLTLFDLLGRTVREYAPASSWLLGGVPSGHYIARYMGLDGNSFIVLSTRVICD